MMTLDEIKKLMAADDTAQADEALKELLAVEPNNLQAKMLYGICRQLLGDEETFRRIHDELAPRMETKGSDELNLEEAKCWNKYDELFAQLSHNALCDGRKQKNGPALMEYVVLAVLIASAIAAGVIYCGRKIKDQMTMMMMTLTTYAVPPHHKLVKIRDTQMATNENVQVVTNRSQEVDHAPIKD